MVLLYHGFTDRPRSDDPEHLFVLVDELARQLDHLLGRGWTPLDLDGYLAVREGARRPRRSFLVTIDDGFRSVGDLAGPVLARRGVPSVLFVPSGLMGRTATWLPEPQDEGLLDPLALRRLVAEAPVEIGGHGHDHSSMVARPPGDLLLHTAAVRQELGAVAEREVRAFAYPYGDHDEQARAAVADAGYLVGFSVYDDEGAFAVSRVDVNSTDTLLSFRVKLLPGYRTWWRLLSRATVLRRTVRFLVSRGGRR